MYTSPELSLRVECPEGERFAETLGTGIAALEGTSGGPVQLNPCKLGYKLAIQKIEVIWKPRLLNTSQMICTTRRMEFAQ